MNRINENIVDRSKLYLFLGRYGTIIILLLMVIFFSIFLAPFRTLDNFLNLFGNSATLAIFAVGLTCCLKVGDFDLSIGAVAALAGIVVAKMMVSGNSIPLSIIAALIAGVLIGIVNGVLVAKVNLNAFVATLATMSIILGLAQGITEGSSIWSGIPKAFEVIGRGVILGLPYRFIIAFSLLLIIWFVHAYTRTGRRMEAIGGNPSAARVSGIAVEWNRMLAFIFSGGCSAIAGIVLTSGLMSANPTQGTQYLLDAFGACFIGAATIRIGQFHVWGTFVGVFIVVVATNGLIILMVPGYLMDMIKGMILLLAILLSSVVGKYLRG
jgi:ribose transport system permease protein